MAFFDKKPTPPSIDPKLLSGHIELEYANLPLMQETLNGKYVNYGVNNLYPQYLVGLSKTSALHRTLVVNKSKLVCGDLYINDLPLDEWIASLSGPQQIRIQNLFYNSKYPFRDWMKKTAYDYQLFGAYSTEVIWNTDFEYIKLFKHIDTSKIRSGCMNKDGEIDKYYYSRTWGGYQHNQKITPISVFDIENEVDYNQIIYKKEYNPDLNYYTEPTYIGGLTYINLDSELGVFNLAHVQNGFSPGLIFKVPYSPQTDEEKFAVIQTLTQNYKGARNKNNPFVVFKNGELTWEIEKVDLPELDQYLISLSDIILQQLLFAHQITNGALVGLSVPGKIGNSSAEEIAFSEQYFDQLVIEPSRLVMEETIEDILRTHQLNVTAKIKNTPKITNDTSNNL